MFNKNYNYSSLDNKFQKRAEILFNHPDNEKNINKLKMKNLPLGKSVYDEDDDDDKPLKLAKSEKIKGSELDILDEFDKNNKNASEKNPDKKQTEIKSKKEKTEEEQQEILDLMYPSMKNIDKKEISSKINKQSKTDEDKNKDALKILGMDESKYQIKGNTISKKPEDYEVINGIKYLNK